MTSIMHSKSSMPKLLTATALALASALAAAHGDHGFDGTHGRAGDLFGPAVLLGCAAAALGLRSKK